MMGPQASNNYDSERISATLLETLRQLVAEVHADKPVAVDMDSALDRDLGLDSLARVELLTRLEKALGLHLSENSLAVAETPRDLLRLALASFTEISSAALEGQEIAMVPAVGVAGGEGVPVHASTLVEVLEWQAQAQADRTAIYLCGETGQDEPISYADLLRGAQRVAMALQQRELDPGQTVAIMLPTSAQFFYSFYGVLLAGGVPVPIYPPLRRAALEEHVRRQAAILNNALAAVLITVQEARSLVPLVKSLVPSLKDVLTVDNLPAPVRDGPWPKLKARDIALIQYTSGSTGNPKGVVLTHNNLLANIRAMGDAIHADSRDIFVSWLPLYHDMGLIGAGLGTLYYSIPLVLMSPMNFLVRPERWLWAIHRYGATLSAAPNFAYELCLRKIDDKDMEGLDLSTWRIAFNGAEPVSRATITGFTQRFSSVGFDPHTMMPVYGLAENAVGLAFPPMGRGPLIDCVDRDTYMRHGRALPIPEGDSNALCFVAGGRPIPQHQIRLVDHTGRELPEREEGRVEFRGPSATSGYYRHPEASRELFDGEWLDSGDKGYMVGGELFITGRAKDIIIRGGRNIYPHELEQGIGNIAEIRKGSVAAFGTKDSTLGTERLVVMAESRVTDGGVLERLRGEINSVVIDLVGGPPDDVVLVRPNTVLKTSSGKIRRAACRELYEAGPIRQRRRPVWEQWLRLTLMGIAPRMGRVRRQFAKLLFAGYVWLLFSVMALGVWLAVVLLPRQRWRETSARQAARWLLRLSATRLTVRGLEHLPKDGAYIVVANHASYVDAIILTAVLPVGISYVAKRELAQRFFARVLLQRLGCAFVERFDPQRSIEDTERLVGLVAAGRSLVIFPEGTFTRAPGLRAFRMGAFMVAAQSGAPLVPLAITGSRSMLRSEQWFPRRGSLGITITAPLYASGKEWDAAVVLRDRARAQILTHSGEHELS